MGIYAKETIIEKPRVPQCSLQHYLPELDIQAGFRKGRGTRDQIANIPCIIEKAREFQKYIYFCFIDSAKAFDGVENNKLWKIFKEMGIPDHLTCLLRNLYAGQEATVGNRWGNSGNSVKLFFWAPKSLQMVIAAMILKHAYSSEGKL